MPPVTNVSQLPRVALKRGMIRDIFCNFEGFAELTPTTGTSQAGETGEGQTLSSGTATLAAEAGFSPAVPITLNSATATVSGYKLVVTVTVPATADIGTYSILWVGVTNQGKQVSERVYYDVKT